MEAELTRYEFCRMWNTYKRTDPLWWQCKCVSANEEEMTVEEYIALNKRREKDPFCD